MRVCRAEKRSLRKEKDNMHYEKNIMVPMRDGTRLATDLYIPDGPGPFPMVLERTPYDKLNATMMWTGTHTYLVEKGYVVAMQDTRGRYASEGAWYPLRDDGWGKNQDGYDTVKWLSEHAVCNGSVGTFGGSYSGNTQYLMAPTRPPGLKCMFVRQGSSDLTEEWVYRGGAFELGLNLHWGIDQSIAAMNNRVTRLTKALGEQMEEVFGQLPLFSHALYSDPLQWLKDILSHYPEDEAFWDDWNLTKKYSKIDVPILHFGSWYDLFIRATLANFVGLSEQAATEKARSSQRLFIGPWMHGPLVGESFMRRVGELDFGPEAVIVFNDLVQGWFDYWLKGIENGLSSEPRVTIFVMGQNRWKKLKEWPPRDARYVNYYLHTGPSKSASSLNDGALNEVAPTSPESSDEFSYDPMKPVRTLGGNTLYAMSHPVKNLPKGLSEAEMHMAELGLEAGPRDQRPAEGCSLTYTTAPLAKDLEVTGPLVVRAYVSSTAEDTDFVALLTDVWPDGRSILITDGILRARYRESKTRPVPMRPGEIYMISIDLWATSNVFRKGHRIRLRITSSNYPRFDRNLNIWKKGGSAAEAVVARNTIFHDRERPSHLVLPIVDGGTGNNRSS